MATVVLTTAGAVEMIQKFKFTLLP